MPERIVVWLIAAFIILLLIVFVLKPLLERA